MFVATKPSLLKWCDDGGCGRIRQMEQRLAMASSRTCRKYTVHQFQTLLKEALP